MTKKETEEKERKGREEDKKSIGSKKKGKEKDKRRRIA